MGFRGILEILDGKDQLGSLPISKSHNRFQDFVRG